MSSPIPTNAPSPQSDDVTISVNNLPQLMKYLVDVGGSDLHLTSGLPPVVRLHGDLIPVPGFSMMTPNVLEPVLRSILSPQQLETFDNDHELDMAYSVPGVGRFRVNLFQQRNTMGSVMRNIPMEIPPFNTLRLPESVLKLTTLPRGLVLVTGPTGSGKSTTLASMIDEINMQRRVHIMTIEDPIEFLHRHKRSVINQRELGLDTYSFAAALRHVLRQDPDVILVGELRDLETIQLSLTAAETGHLVFGTLHTQDAPQTIDRMVDVFPPDQQEQIRVMLSSTLMGVVSQQLLKTADGRGRAVAAEVMVATSAIRNLIREGKTHQMYNSITSGAALGMVSMDQSLANLVRSGLVKLETALARAQHPQDLENLLQRR